MHIAMFFLIINKTNHVIWWLMQIVPLYSPAFNRYLLKPLTVNLPPKNEVPFPTMTTIPLPVNMEIRLKTTLTTSVNIPNIISTRTDIKTSANTWFYLLLYTCVLFLWDICWWISDNMPIIIFFKQSIMFVVCYVA